MLLLVILIAMPASIRYSAAIFPGFRDSDEDADLRAREEEEAAGRAELPGSAADRLGRRFRFRDEIAVTKSISSGFQVNAGYEYPKPSTPNASFSPAIAGSSGANCSIGSGQQLDSLSSALARPSTCARTGSGSLDALTDGPHAFDSNAITISLGHHF
jgi:hypothetical protein